MQWFAPRLVGLRPALQSTLASSRNCRCRASIRSSPPLGWPCWSSPRSAASPRPKPTAPPRPRPTPAENPFLVPAYFGAAFGRDPRFLWLDVRGNVPGGVAPERVTRTSAFYDKLAYSKDGTRLLAIWGSRLHRTRTLEDFGFHDGASELEYVWLPASGGDPTRITWVGAGTTEEGRNAPHIGPDPGRVYLWAGSEGLLSMRYDGTDLKTIVKVTGPQTPGFFTGMQPAPPDEVVLSPDGSVATTT